MRIFHPILLREGQVLCLATSNGTIRSSTYCSTHPVESVVFLARQVFTSARAETGHIDFFATFTDPNTVVIGDYSGMDEKNAEILNRNAEQLSKINTARGPLKVVRIPKPARQENYFGGTYTNVVFANGVLLVPSWPDLSPEVEERVMATYRQLLPDWDVIGIDASEIMLHGGALRCLSKRQASH